jgi:hypothetical protein
MKRMALYSIGVRPSPGAAGSAWQDALDSPGATTLLSD